MIAGVDEYARSRAPSLAGCSRLCVTNVPDDVVIDLVLLPVHLHVHRRTYRQDVGKYTWREPAVCVAAVEPDRIPVPYVTDHVAAEEHVVSAVKFGSGRFPFAF